MRFLKNVPSTTSTSSALYYDRKPDTAGKFQTFRRYLYDGENGTACNRTAASWGFLLVFYFLFLGCCWSLLVFLIYVGVAAIDYFGEGQLVDVSSMKHPIH